MNKQHIHRRQKARGRFKEWLYQMSPEEQSLHGDAFRYEGKYFRDLTLEEPRVCKALTSYKIKGEDGDWHKTDAEFYGELTIDEPWVFLFRDFKGSRKDFYGLCESRRYRILINKGLSKEEIKTTLLHEMIHAYEEMLAQYPGIRDWLMIDLYKRMLKKLGQKKVEKCLRVSTHVFHGDADHTSLFLLKSLDLDLRHRWKLGTVFGYGREELFQD